MIQVVARFNLGLGNGEEAIAIAKELIDKTRQEKGCIRYILVQSVETPDNIAILEEWESQADLDVHSASAHFQELVPKLAALCSEAPMVQSYTVLY